MLEFILFSVQVEILIWEWLSLQWKYFHFIGITFALLGLCSSSSSGSTSSPTAPDVQWVTSHPIPCESVWFPLLGERHTEACLSTPSHYPGSTWKAQPGSGIESSTQGHQEEVIIGRESIYFRWTIDGSAQEGAWNPVGADPEQCRTAPVRVEEALLDSSWRKSLEVGGGSKQLSSWASPYLLSPTLMIK